MTLIASYVVLFLFGVLIGNFTTTVFHRLPRDIMICGFDQKSTRPPFCSSCKHILRFYEYLPILSWFSTFGKCNYCGGLITKSYIALEILLGLMAVALYYVIGSNLEYFFIYFCFSALVLLSIFIYLKHSFIPIRISLSIVILGMIYRTLIEHEIFLWITSLSLATILSLWIMRNSLDDKSPSDINKSWVNLVLPASLWCRSYESLSLFFINIIFWYSISKITRKELFYPLGIISLFFISLQSLI